MSEFELVVLGGGTGNIVASAAAEEGLDVASSGIRRAGASTSPATRSTHDNGYAARDTASTR